MEKFLQWFVVEQEQGVALDVVLGVSLALFIIDLVLLVVTGNIWPWLVGTVIIILWTVAYIGISMLVTARGIHPVVEQHIPYFVSIKWSFHTVAV